MWHVNNVLEKLLNLLVINKYWTLAKPSQKQEQEVILGPCLQLVKYSSYDTSMQWWPRTCNLAINKQWNM